jgi:hypothetical protein
MAYWRMQLHPSESFHAIQHITQSLTAGFIGLDFAGDVPDLTTVERDSLPPTQEIYYDFAHTMGVGDHVLVFAHHFPFALVEVAGNYNYIREHVPEIGVWFRHFRRVTDVRYYGDFETDARSWERIPMTGTIGALVKPESASWRLIERWLSPV